MTKRLRTYGSWRQAIATATPHFPEAVPYHDRLYQRSVEIFRAEHGRDPLPSDLIIPVVRTEDETAEHYEAIANRMEVDGFPPAFVHAVRRTHILAITDEFQAQLTSEDRAMWDAAVAEYSEFKRLSDEAEAAGEHPALVLALLRSGMRFPKGAKLKTTRLGDHKTSVQFSLDTPYLSLNAAWAEAIQDYQRQNPDDDSIYDILRRAGSD